MMLEQLSNIYLDEGLRNLQQKRLTTAETCFEQAALIKSANWEALNLQGLCLYTSGEFKRAEGLWKRSIDINSQEVNRAQYYISSLKEPGFLSLCELYNEALRYAREGNFKKAGKLLKNEKFSEHKIIPFINLKGLCMLAAGSRREAVSLWKEALLIDAENECAFRYITDSFDGRKETRFLFIRISQMFGKSN